MPRLSGIDLLKRVRSSPRFKDIPFVLVTAASDLDTVRKAVTLGISHYIIKPFHAREARGALQKILNAAWERIAEPPSATLNRLNIAPDQLMSYLYSLRGQCTVFTRDLWHCKRLQDIQGVVERLKGLHTGCLTLGLHYAADLEQAMPNAESPGPSSQRHTQTAMMAERAAVLLLLALLLYGVIRVLEPFGLAIAFGGFIAIGTWPLRDALVHRGLPRGITATLMLLVLILSLAVPALALTPELGGQIAHASKVVRELLAGLPEAPPAWLAALPLLGGIISNWWPQLLNMQGDFSALLAPYTGRITSLLVEIGQAAAASVVQILLAMIVATAFWVSGEGYSRASRRGNRAQCGGSGRRRGAWGRLGHCRNRHHPGSADGYWPGHCGCAWGWGDFLSHADFFHQPSARPAGGSCLDWRLR